MKSLKYLYFATPLCLALLLACGDSNPTTPSQPTTPTPTPAPAPASPAPAPAPAPTPAPTPTPPPNPVLGAPSAVAPTSNEQLNTLRPTLTVTNASSDQQGARTYEFQVSDNAQFTLSSESLMSPFAVVATKEVPEGADGRTSFTVETDLQPTTLLYWRARAKQGSTIGPYSSTLSFRTRVQGYNRAGELYDPLVNGETVGERNGNTTFLPNRGLQLQDNSSHVIYRLVRGITAGEISMMVSMANSTSGDKTKVFTMFDGRGEIHDHPWRYTVERRTSGRVAWRYIAGGQGQCQIETEGDGERVILDLGGDSAPPNFWRSRWSNGIDVTVRRGSPTGPEIYSAGKSTCGTYRPDPHIATLGSTTPRSGSGDQSIPGAVYSHVWIGERPRPANLGTALAR